MGSGSEEDSGKAVSGEVTTAEEKKAKEKRMAVREQNRATIAGAIFSRLSRVPFVNVWLRKKIDTARDVVRGETELFKDLVDHDESFRRLENIDIILRETDAAMEASATAAENKFAEEKRKAAARETDDRIFAEKKKREEAELEMKNKYDLQILEAGYKIQLDPLKKKAEKLEEPPEPPQKKTTRAPSPKQKLREAAHKRYEKETARIEKMKVSAKTKTELKKAAENELEEEMQRIDKMP